MTSIIRATPAHSPLLSTMATETLLQSHATSPAAEGLNSYAKENYNEDVLKSELNDENNIYHIIYHNGQAAGYSKIMLNTPYTTGGITTVAKLDRLYLLADFYDLKLGRELFHFNVELAKRNNQAGIWLYTWTGNNRAINFYKKNGFIIIGSHDFKVTAHLSNPNHQMYMEF